MRTFRLGVTSKRTNLLLGSKLYQRHSHTKAYVTTPIYYVNAGKVIYHA